MSRRGLTALLGAVLFCASGAVRAAPATPAACCDWPEFGYDAQRDNDGPAATGITAANVGTLVRRQITLDGTVDSSPILLHDVSVAGRERDVVVVTTTYGRTEAIDAHTGSVLWRFTPPGYASFAGSPQITTASPLADPSRTAVYAAAPDGELRKLSLATGAVLWATAITLDPTRERLASAINEAGGMLIMTLGGYIGDIPPYTGEVVTLDPATGEIIHVWNALCSNRHALIVPSTCGGSDAGIWGRSGAVVVPGSGDLLVATGNGPFDGRVDWGDSMLELSPTASRLLGHWTPVDQASLNSGDVDLGSTSPALLPGGLALQGGKDGQLALIALDRLDGVDAATGGALQTVEAPGAAQVFSEPAVWHDIVVVSTGGGTAAWRLAGGRLHPLWLNATPGTSPVVAGGLVYIEGSGGIAVYDPTDGTRVGTLPIGEVHWQSPIVADGLVVAAEGDADAHATSGVLDIYRLP